MPQRSNSSIPRWVKVFGIIAIGLALLFVIVIVLGGGDHGPGRHVPSGDTGGHTQLSIAYGNSGDVGRPTAADEAQRAMQVITVKATQFEPGRSSVPVEAAVTRSAQPDRDSLRQILTGVQQQA